MYRVSILLEDSLERKTMKSEKIAFAFLTAALYMDDNKNKKVKEIIIKEKNRLVFNYTNGEVLVPYGEDKVIVKDLLSINEGMIGHGVNCLGVMGAGVAASIRLKYPSVYSLYKKHVDSEQYNKLLMGTVLVVKPTPSLYVANLFTQLGVASTRSDVAISYEAIMYSMQELINRAEGLNLKEVYIPRIGSDLGGGNWLFIRSMYNALFENRQVKLNVVVRINDYAKHYSKQG